MSPEPRRSRLFTGRREISFAEEAAPFPRRVPFAREAPREIAFAEEAPSFPEELAFALPAALAAVDALDAPDRAPLAAFAPPPAAEPPSVEKTLESWFEPTEEGPAFEEDSLDEEWFHPEEEAA